MHSQRGRRFAFGRMLVLLLLFGGLVTAASLLIPGLTQRSVAPLLAQAAPGAAQDTLAPMVTQTIASPEGMHDSTPFLARLNGLVGIGLILLIGWLFSHRRRSVKWRIVFWGLGLQFLFAIFVLRVPLGQRIFRDLGAFVTKILSYSYAGS